MNKISSSHTHAEVDNFAKNGAECAHKLKDTCRRLGCSRSSLYAMAGRGLITFHKIGGRTVVMESEIIRILRNAPKAEIRTRS